MVCVYCIPITEYTYIISIKYTYIYTYIIIYYNFIKSIKMEIFADEAKLALDVEDSRSILKN